MSRNYQEIQTARKPYLKNISTPAKKNAPLSATHRTKVELALIEERKKNKALLKEKINNEIIQKSVRIGKAINYG